MTNATPARTTFESDVLAFTFIRKDWLELELGLFATKWFDYRQLTPVEATERYIDAYRLAFRNHYARALDRERADHIKVLGGEDPLAGFPDRKMRNKLVGCWRGRQVADMLGMPYETYTELAMGFRLRFWQRAYLPQPQHLYHEMDLEKIQARWEELQTAKLFYSELPVYRIESYRGVAFQNDHHEWLIGQAQKRSNSRVVLARFVQDGLLPIEKAYARTPERLHDELRREIEHSAQLSV